MVKNDKKGGNVWRFLLLLLLAIVLKIADCRQHDRFWLVKLSASPPTSGGLLLAAQTVAHRLGYRVARTVSPFTLLDRHTQNIFTLIAPYICIQQAVKEIFFFTKIIMKIFFF